VPFSEHLYHFRALPDGRPHEIIPVGETPMQMLEASNHARRTLGEFLAAFHDPKPGQEFFAINACFNDGRAVEHLWLAELDFETNPPTGVVAVEPRVISIGYLQRVPFLPTQIADWLFCEDNRIVGGFTLSARPSLPCRPEPPPTSRFTLLRELWRL
jgi:uncharacterized protein YegJ (DUF2314 family)